MKLDVTGTVPGIDEAAFAEAAEGARDNCPVSARSRATSRSCSTRGSRARRSRLQPLRRARATASPSGLEDLARLGERLLVGQLGVLEQRHGQPERDAELAEAAAARSRLGSPSRRARKRFACASRYGGRGPGGTLSTCSRSSSTLSESPRSSAASTPRRWPASRPAGRRPACGRPLSPPRRRRAPRGASPRRGVSHRASRGSTFALEVG